MSQEVKYKGHFKFYILPKYRFTFESELEKRDIDFDVDTNIPNSTYIRYFLRDSDRKDIDEIITQNQIVANLESLPSLDYQESRRTMFLVIAMAALLTLMFLVYHFLDSNIEYDLVYIKTLILVLLPFVPAVISMCTFTGIRWYFLFSGSISLDKFLGMHFLWQPFKLEGSNKGVKLKRMHNFALKLTLPFILFGIMISSLVSSLL